jgi:hypothetical protein
LFPADLDLPTWSSQWSIFAGWSDLGFALAGLLLALLLVLWWRQQTKVWLRVVLGALLVALLLAIASFYFFVVPPHFAGCPTGCAGWRGYPLRIALFRLDGVSEVGAADFALNVLILFLLVLTASTVWSLAATVVRLGERGRRWKILFVLLLVLSPWAFLPRILNPPQPALDGEDLRLANNARRAAEFTYGITGLWIHRLAIEDLRRDLAPEMIAEFTGADTVAAEADGASELPAVPAVSAAARAELQPAHMVCLRGYTYFFVPWSRYRIALGADGATALSLTPLPLRGSCWDPPPL